MQLLERDAQSTELATLLDAAAQGHGACALVLGEAGIGKTALVRALADASASVDVLWGGCEALYTPRPLGPIVDMAHAFPPELAARVGEGHTYNGLFPALLAYLRQSARPTLLVIDDAQWADEGTLDCIKYLGRRIERTRTLLVITARSDELGVDHPLRRVLGELPAASTRRIELAPLSRQAIDRLAQAAGRSAALLQKLSGGNPFLLTELLAADDTQVPGSVRDAVLARVARLSPRARRVIELVAVEPARLERTLVAACFDDAGEAEGAIDEARASGVLQTDAEWLFYRHEIARRGVEGVLDPRRQVELHTLVLDRLRGAPNRRDTLPRQVHHAHAAGLRDQVAALAPQAAEQAARAGAHREAAALYRLALGDGSSTPAQPPAERATLLEAASRELQLVNALEDAIALREQALALRRDERADRAIGRDLRLLGVLHGQLTGTKGPYLHYAQEAVDVLEPLGPSSELAKAYATLSHVLCLCSEYERATEWGERAVSMAGQFDDPAAQVLAWSRLGAARIYRADDAAARVMVERALALAIDSGFEGLAAEIFVTLQTLALIHHDHAYSLDVGARGLAYCEARDLDGAISRLLSRRAHSLLQLGRWDESEREYAACLAVPSVTATIRDSVRFVLHRQAARRGRAIGIGAGRQVPEGCEGTACLAAIDDFWRDLQRDVSRVELEFRAPAIAAACAEAAWLRGDVAAAVEVARIGLREALRTEDSRLAGPLLVWLQRLDADGPALEGALHPAFARELAGDRAGAAGTWERLQVPYERALVLAFGDGEQMRAALAIFDALGAERAAQVCRARLRISGERARATESGPRRSTRHDPLGLTVREREVFQLLVRGLSNDAIARQLRRSERTVEHHVSAVLGKVGAKSRTELLAMMARDALGTRITP